MSYPPPSGPQDPRPQDNRPQDRPSQLPSWQQQPYQPQGGNWAAPQYGGPPRKNRGGLIIGLIVVLVLAIVGIGGFVTYNLTSGDSDGGTAAASPSPSPSGPVSTPTRPPAPPKTVPSAVPTKAVPSSAPSSAPSKPVGTAPVGTTPADALALVGRFVSNLNAGNTEAATALGCADTRALIPTLIGSLIKAPTNLAVDGKAIGQDPYLVQISGTTNGKSMAGMVIIQGGCVRVFNLAPS